ncbi:MAG TPA: hypothetical protein VJS69_05580, partial [Candidatus Krumholzibacteria bacterium]|nr:hypothetical protein [Candidatus Krumholzibacteria bacterium]
MRKRYCAFIGIAVGILLLQPNRPQATTFLTIAPDASGSSCYVADPGPNQLVTMYVVAKFSAGSTAFQFSAPVSPTSGLTFVGDQSQYYMVGSSQTTAVVSLDMCTTGTFSV